MIASHRKKKPGGTALAVQMSHVTTTSAMKLGAIWSTAPDRIMRLGKGSSGKGVKYHIGGHTHD